MLRGIRLIIIISFLILNLFSMKNLSLIWIIKINMLLPKNASETLVQQATFQVTERLKNTATIFGKKQKKVDSYESTFFRLSIKWLKCFLLCFYFVFTLSSFSFL